MLNSFTGEAQESTPLAQSPGVPSGSYALSDIDSVNPFNGRVNVHLSLINEAGRGGAKRRLSFTVDSPAPWNVGMSYDTNGNPFYFVEPGMRSDGIHPGDYSIRGETSGEGQHQCWSGFTEEYWAWIKTRTRVFLVEPDGTEHEMRDVLTGGRPLDSSSYCPFNWPHTGPSRGRVFVSTDGSGATLIYDTDLKDGIKTDEPYPSGGGGAWILFKDGRKIAVDSGLRDRNGNMIWTGKDSLNRTVSSGADSGSQCTSLLSGTAICEWYSQKGFSGAERKIWITYNSSFTPTGIFLPNGLSYRFSYNSYGDLTRIDLPSGGSIEYDYGPGLDGQQPDVSYWVQGVIPGTYSDTTTIGYHVYRRVTERRAYREGHVLESKQTFSKAESTAGGNLGYVEQKQIDANGNPLNTERHYFYGSANSSFLIEGTNYVSWKAGREYRGEFYDPSGNLLRATDTTWEQRAPVSWWTGSADDAPQNDPRVSQTVSYLENGLSSTTTSAYDPTVPYNSVTDVYNYDYSGAPLRHTHTTYLKTLNGVDYTGSNLQNGSSPHMRDLPVQASVYDGNGIERARTSFEYDNYNSDTNHAPLVDRPGISGFDSIFNASYTTRGNVTATTRYLLTNGSVTGSITGYALYDIAGNVVKVIDARGCATTFDFADRFGAPDSEARANSAPIELSSVGQSSYAFATSVTNCLGQTAYVQFDYYLGQPVNGEDANGIVSSAYFNDALDRPTQIIRAANQDSTVKSQSTFSYDDTNRIVTVTSDQIGFNDNLLKSQTIYDGLGRTIESRQYENSTQYIAVRQVPFVMLLDGANWLLAAQTSNPFRPYLGEQPIWTTSFFDSLSRVIKVKTPDNAIVTSSYGGNTVTVSDQTGKSRRSVSDALGRLTSVYEDPNGLNHVTNYSYDVLGDLLTVSQGSQPRSFAYDSLSRLTSAANPESGTVSYQYDNNGNLLSKTDARSITTNFAYDALNRVTSRSYQNDSSGTPAVTYSYDSTSISNGKGRLASISSSVSSYSYSGYDALGRATGGTQTIGSQSYNVGYSYDKAGHVLTETYPSGRTVTNVYDDAGRTSSVTGNLGGTSRNYATGIIYDAGSRMTKEQFGTSTAIYNKLFYNSRGQLAEIREGTYNASDNTWWNRGAIINHYSNNYGCWGASCNAPDNNGNLMKQEVYIPADDQISSYTMRWQQYDYDSLNRINWVREIAGGAEVWRQTFTYDRYGNRTIDYNNTSSGIPRPQFAVDTSTNRLGVPNGQTGTMTYDNAGNLTTDTYSAAAVTRGYDAENRMISETQANNYVAGSYSYDGDGRRVKRNVNGVVTWQVYGLGGELLAEYAQNSSPSSPQKEYGYRNGQLLITADAASGGGGSGAQSVTWTNAVGVTVNGNNLTKTAADGWGNAGAASTQSITSGDGYVECTVSETSTNRMIGLSHGDTNQSYEDIDFAMYPIGGATLQIYEGGSFRGSFGNYATGDILRVTVESGVVKYRKNGQLIYTSAVAPTYPLLVDAALYSNGSTLNNVVISGAGGGGTSSAQIYWLVTDQLGTPRMVFDQTGSLATVSRHDYLPFGEELLAGTGGRTTTQGYTAPGYSAIDGARQKFTGYEHDGETGLEFAQARYYASMQGRFTGADPVSGHAVDPQSWNMYAYVGNNPVNLTDPTGMNYFVGGSGAADPFIDEFRVDGFELSPEGSNSKIEETPSLASWTPNSFIDNEGMLPSGDSEERSEPQNSGQQYASDSTMVIAWDKSGWWANPLSYEGHVSYVTMQNDTSYSFQSPFRWTYDQPSSKYTNERSKRTAGIGYILDFSHAGAAINAKFQKALLRARRGDIYDPFDNNCANPFVVAINAIHKEIGTPYFTRKHMPIDVKNYIEKYLQPKGFVAGGQLFPKH